jgi:hypothetical protein
MRVERAWNELASYDSGLLGPNLQSRTMRRFTFGQTQSILSVSKETKAAIIYEGKNALQ